MCLCVKSRPCFSLPSFNGSGLHRTATAGLLALLLCGDIQLNPGPKCKSVYPCGYCGHNVDYGAKAICCDNCDIWFHKSCVSMSSTMYSELNSVEDRFCYRCFTHYCDTFHAYGYSVHTSNSFSALMTASADEVLITPLLSIPRPTVVHITHSLLLLLLISPPIPVQPMPPPGPPLATHMTRQRRVTTGEPLCVVSIASLARQPPFMTCYPILSLTL